MSVQKQLRVLIVGQQDQFHQVIVANIQRLGYEVVSLPAILDASDVDTYAITGDILLYDLDEPYRRVEKQTSLPRMRQELFAVEILRNWQLLRDRVRLTMVSSSHSVSRATLAHLEAVALLYKPFEIGQLQRYLRTFERVLSLEAPEISGLPVEQEHDVALRVLIVDDDVNMAHWLGKCLRHAGFAVAFAHDGLEALEQCMSWQPQCVVTDLIMPWMNGYQVMHCLSQRVIRPMPAFIVVSALTQLEGIKQRSYLTGKSVTYVDKPFHIEHLVTAIKQVVQE